MFSYFKTLEELGWKKVKWKHPNRKRIKEGYYTYVWQSDCFIIRLNNNNIFKTYNDTPEWDKWKLIKEEQCHTNLL